MKAGRTQSKSPVSLAKPHKSIFRGTPNLHRLLIIILIAIFYGNTLTLDYALDDRMIILENKYLIQGGWDGLKSIFTKDSFSGYFGEDKANIVAGGRYRPMSQLTFMIEFQLLGQKIKRQLGDISQYETLHSTDSEKYFTRSALPVVSHFFNVLYFILLCLFIYEVLRKIFPACSGNKWFQSLPFIATVFFALHPIHTEAVANIKGRDEIFAMLGAMMALWCSLKYVEKRQWYFLLISLLAIMFGVFSKENAITFLAVVPIALFFYPNNQKKKIDYWLTILPVLMGSIFFILVRSHVLGGMLPEDTTHNILNNPYVDSTKAQELATVLLTWGIYLKLLVFPHPLTHDYYPKQIAITDFSNPLVWCIGLFCLAVIVYALLRLKKKSVISFGILFFVVTFSITSNLLFNLGTFMNERFVFIPSLGFTLIIGYWLYRLSIVKATQWRWVAPVLLTVAGLLYGGKTFARNLVWKNDFTLFLTDVKTSSNSIKCNISAGGSCLQIWEKTHKESDKAKAYKYLQKALQLDDHALNAHLLLGELLFYDNNPEGAYQAYSNAAAIDPQNQVATENVKKMQLINEDNTLKPIRQLLDEGHAQEALQQIEAYLSQHPESLIAQNLRGNVYGRGFGQLDKAIDIFEEIIAKDPHFANAWENMGIAYALKGEFDRAVSCLNTALQNAPDDENILQNLYLVYLNAGNQAKAEEIKQKIKP